MCTGRVDLAFLLRAFQKGADGVIVGGCWLGECHYVTEGNYYALNLTEALQLEPDGMVRIGLLHYNTDEEVQRLLAAIDQLKAET